MDPCHEWGSWGSPFPEEVSAPPPAGRGSGPYSLEVGATRRFADGESLSSPRGSPFPAAGSGGRLGGAAGPLRALFWRRLGVIDRSLGNAIRLSGWERQADGGRAGEARGFL